MWLKRLREQINAILSRLFFFYSILKILKSENPFKFFFFRPWPGLEIYLSKVGNLFLIKTFVFVTWPIFFSSWNVYF